jgi:hypothetical protein
MTTTQHEVIQKGYRALIDALGPVDAIRFIQHFSPGQGDYTRERHQWLASITQKDFFAQLQQLDKATAAEDPEHYDEVIE